MRIIKFVTIDNLSPTGKLEKYDLPEWSLIEQLINRLDGTQFTEVSLMAEEEEIGMNITGGDNGYLCEVITDENCYVLINSDSPTENYCSIVKNGPPDFPERMVVDRDKVFEVARYYFETGKLNPHFSWEK